MNDLWKEFEEVKTTPVLLDSFHKKISSLKFLDPACGCGNFLIIAYRELCNLEYELLRYTKEHNNFKVSINQFYGIEIEESSALLAQLGLQMVQYLMNRKFDISIDDKANIVCGNALTMDWNEVVPSSELSYILGNPPFLGARVMNKEQKAEIKEVFGNIKQVENFDYVCAWYKKASDVMEANRQIKTSFVSTNSISQGEQVSILWKPLMERGFHINFAYRSFEWSNEAKNNATVYCVIIGFSLEKKCKFICDKIKEKDVYITPSNINGYLKDGKNIFVDSRNTPISNIPPMKFGSMPRDGGHFVIKKDEYEEILSKEPQLECVLKPYIGAEEFLHNKERWCIWLHNEPLSVIANSKILQKKIALVEEFRLSSPAKTTNQYAKVPSIFAQIAHPYTNYMIIPGVSSANRNYIPIGFMDKDTIASDAVQIIPNAELYHFAILTSSVHMAWIKVIAGRLGIGYRYSKDAVYNNFPWVENITEEQKNKIGALAQRILDVRTIHSDVTLAFLYSKSMPTDLRKAHENLDREVMKLYGYSKDTTEDEIVADLLNRYERLVTNKTIDMFFEDSI